MLFRAIQTDLPFEHEYISHTPFSCIALLNVLDRCLRPISILEDIHSHLLKHGGVLLLAIVLPCHPFVEESTYQISPLEDIQV